MATTSFAQSIGDVTIVPAPELASSTVPIVVANLDGNVYDDVIVGMTSPYVFAPMTLVAVSMNPGAPAGWGGLLPALTIPQLPGTFQVLGVRAADMDGDGDIDIVVHTRDTIGRERVDVVDNDGVGNFGVPRVLIPPGAPFLWSIGDFDADGADDVIVVLALPSAPSVIAGATLTIFDGLGAILFAAPNVSFSGTQSIIVDDWNADGAADAVLAGGFLPGQATTSVSFNGAAGGGFAPLFASPFSIFSPPATVTGADFNGDGFNDLLAAQGGSGTAFLTYLGSIGGLGPSTLVTSTIGSQPMTRAVADDFNLDGLPELIALPMPFSVPLGSTMSVVFGHFAPTAPLATANFVTRAIPGFISNGPLLNTRIATGDFDGDGDRDLLVAAVATSIVASQIPSNAAFFFLENRAVFGSGCAGIGGVPTFRMNQPWIQNQIFAVRLANAAVTAPGVLLASFAPAPNPGCILVDLSPTQLITLNGSLLTFFTDAIGQFSANANLAGASYLAGVSVVLQYVVVDPQATFSIGSIGLSTTVGRTVDFF